MPQTKVKYFVLVFLTKSFMPIPPSSHPQLLVNLSTMILHLLEIIYSGTNIQSKAM